MDVSIYDPVVYLEQVVYLRGGSPIEFANNWFRGQSLKLSATVKRPRGAPADSGTPRYVMPRASVVTDSYLKR